MVIQRLEQAAEERASTMKKMAEHLLIKPSQADYKTIVPHTDDIVQRSSIRKLKTISSNTSFVEPLFSEYAEICERFLGHQGPRLFRALDDIWRYEELGYNFEDRRQEFVFRTFSTKKEVFETLSQIQQQCDKILNGTINACVLAFSKPLKLEEFEQVQNQALQQARLTLKDVYV